ncbi:hypothetical protein D3C87_95320 [compost metagenome]
MRIIGLICLLTLSSPGFSQGRGHQIYEYLTMAQTGNEIHLTYGTGKYEVIEVKNEKSKDSHDFRPLLTRMRAYEEQGWELVTNTVYVIGDIPRNYVLMRREN